MGARSLAGRGLEEGAATGSQLIAGDPLGDHAVDHGDLDELRPLQPNRPGVEAELGGGGAESGVELGMVAAGHLADGKPGAGQVVGAAGEPARHHQPPHHPAVLVRLGTLLAEREPLPAVRTDPGEERPCYGCHRVGGEHPRCDEAVPVGIDQRFDLGAGKLGGHGFTACASMASAARRYSPANQSLLRCR